MINTNTVRENVLLENAKQIGEKKNHLNFDISQKGYFNRGAVWFYKGDKLNEINKNYAGRTIDITGYADINGGDKFNLELGYRRAKKVVELLHSLGLSNTVKIGKVSSSGMNNMVSDTNKSANRRVEIIVR